VNETLACTRDTRIGYKIFVGAHERRRQLGVSRYMLENNIKKNRQ
jgi:hypothetical protein